MAFQPKKRAVAKVGADMSPGKRQSLFSIQVDSSGTGGSATRDKKPNQAPIDFSIYKYAAEAADYIPGASLGSLVYAAIIVHEVRPHVDDRMLTGVANMFKVQNEACEDYPKDLKDPKTNEYIWFVHAPEPGATGKGQEGNAYSQNPEKIPYAPYSMVMYCISLQSGLGLLFDYFAHRATHPLEGVDKSPWPPVDSLVVRVFPFTGINVSDIVKDFNQVKKECKPESSVLPRSIFSVPPPAGTHLCVATLEAANDEKTGIAWEGRTYAYRQRFDLAGVTRNDNMRILAVGNRDMSIEANRDKGISIFEEEVKRQAATSLRITGVAPKGDSPVAALLDTLKGKPYIFVNQF